MADAAPRDKRKPRVKRKAKKDGIDDLLRMTSPFQFLDLDRDAAVAQRLRERRAGVPHEPVEAIVAHQTMFTRRPLKVMLCTLALSTPLLILQSLMSPTQL